MHVVWLKELVIDLFFVLSALYIVGFNKFLLCVLVCHIFVCFNSPKQYVLILGVWLSEALLRLLVICCVQVKTIVLFSSFIRANFWPSSSWRSLLIMNLAWTREFLCHYWLRVIQVIDSSICQSQWSFFDIVFQLEGWIESLSLARNIDWCRWKSLSDLAQSLWLGLVCSQGKGLVFIKRHSKVA